MKQRPLKQCFALSTLALCCALSAAPVQAGQAPDESKGPAFTIVGAHVFDGQNWLPPGTQVRVQHGLVLAVGPDVGLPRGGEVIDATGKTLVPEPADKPDGTSNGRGAIRTGAYADLRLVEGNSTDWSGLGAIVARWHSGVQITGNHLGSKPTM
jgi:hypothetical protein